VIRDTFYALRIFFLMNIYTVIILFTILLSYTFDLVADILNLKALYPDLPDEFKDVYDADVYRKSQEYERVNTRFGFVTSTFGLLVTLVFWFAGGFNWLDQILRF
jgi:STE24 endopeptidase